MSDESDPFAARRPGDVLELVRASPLAWIVCGRGEDFHASLMPIRPWLMDGARITGFASHLPRAHPQVRQLERDPDAHLLFLGPHGYISPSWLEDRSQAPTWNFTSARFRVRVEFMKKPGELRAHLDDLVDAMEAGRPNAWSIPEMGGRLHELMPRIVGFVAHMVDVEERFKLGQDERDEVFADQCAGLEAVGDAPLLEWMRKFNPDRD